MTRLQRTIIAGFSGALIGGLLGTLAATAVTRNRLDFEFAAPGVFLLETTNINTCVSNGASRPTADILVPANAAAYALFFATIGILLYLRHMNAAKAPWYPERLSYGLALTITMGCFPVLLIVSSFVMYFVVLIVVGGMPGRGVSVGIFTLGPAIAADFAIACFLAQSLYCRLRWKKRCEDYPCCPKCGYNLTGNVSGICPECGTPVGTA